MSGGSGLLTGLNPVRLFAGLFLIHGFVGYADVIIERLVASHICMNSPDTKGEVKRKLLLFGFQSDFLAHTADHILVFLLIDIFTYNNKFVTAISDRYVTFFAMLHNG